jgi:hypothetical protein
MTSAIISSTIDADFPIAGQDNDSQGFRDNFTIIKDGLATAGAEITVLQDNTAKTNADNDFNGNVIDNAQTNRLFGTVYTTTTTSLTNVSLNNGEYQDITVSGNHTLTLVDWPGTGLYAKIKLGLKSNGATRTITFATEAGGVIKKEITQALAAATGADRSPSSGATTSGYLSFLKSNLTNTFQASERLFGTGLTGEVVINTVTDLTGITATLTAAPITKEYTAISSGAKVTTSVTSVGITNGDEVTLSDTTGISGLVTTTTYYAYGADGTGFYLAESYSDAISGTPVPGLSGAFSGTATATLPNMTGSNLVTVSSTTGMYTNMPIAFSGSNFGGIVSSTDYYVTVVDSTHIRLSITLGGAPITLTSGSGTLTIVPRETVAVGCTSQVITSGSGLTITTSADMFPVPFTVDADVNKTKIVEAWTTDGGATIFLKYLGEFA